MAQPTTWWSLIDTAGPAALDQGPRSGVMSVVELNHVLKTVVSACPPERRDGILSLAYLWHDQHEAAHALCQAHEGDQHCDYVHALLHRREGDFGNAKYWFREVGQHPAFVSLAKCAQAATVPGCVIRGIWNPTALVDACAAAVKRQSGATSASAVIDLQRQEFANLANHLAVT